MVVDDARLMPGDAMPSMMPRRAPTIPLLMPVCLMTRHFSSTHADRPRARRYYATTLLPDVCLPELLMTDIFDAA